MNDRENDTMRENEGRQVQQELENQLRAFGDTVSDAFAHGFEGKGEDIGDRAYGVGRAAVNAANFGLGKAAKAFRSRREEYYRSRQNAQNTKQGLNEDNINAQFPAGSGRCSARQRRPRQTRSAPVPKSATAQAAHCWQSASRLR